MKNQILALVSQAFAKIHLSASKDPFRAAMQYVEFCTLPEGAQGPAGLYAVATDGNTLFWLNVSETLSNPEVLPADFYLHADQYKKLTGSKVHLIGCDQDTKTIRTMDKAGATLDVLPYLDFEGMRSAAGRFPKWTSVIPTDNFTNLQTGEPHLLPNQIGFDPKLIGRAAQIMEAGPWMVNLRGNDKPVIVQYANPEKNGTAQGLIMPLYIQNPNEREEERQALYAKLAQAYEKAQERKHTAEVMQE
jgi:hypothetical protein